MDVSIVMPLFKPNKEILQKIKERLKEQKFKGKIEIIEINEQKGLAESLNKGILQAKNELVISLHQDCIPEGREWLAQLIAPFKDKSVIASVSQVHLPLALWNSFSFLAKCLTFKERGKITPLLDEKGCAYRKKTLQEIGYFDQNTFRTAGEDFDLFIRINEKGNIAYPLCSVKHMHETSTIQRLKKERQYANGYGTLIRKYKTKMPGWYKGVIKGIPILGLVGILSNYPYFNARILGVGHVIISPLLHILFILGFWEGFLRGKQTL